MGVPLDDGRPGPCILRGMVDGWFESGSMTRGLTIEDGSELDVLPLSEFGGCRDGVSKASGSSSGSASGVASRINGTYVLTPLLRDVWADRV